ncbi:uncharacterized protein LOC106155318 [Lingula anatina]|uniref:Uncharacterized protein LOC106155318 n=1 Tax=Lingula anatina TaxID=7574 RepID=A0A1S3HJB9_LINAN|nr:uncharacterized protein LOC106155318 [Lingula anatina]|eukprot:XP_013385556.1 uncharacterized protein LOC106155318 [Lingula anatina]
MSTLDRLVLVCLVLCYCQELISCDSTLETCTGEAELFGSCTEMAPSHKSTARPLRTNVLQDEVTVTEDAEVTITVDNTELVFSAASEVSEFLTSSYDINDTLLVDTIPDPEPEIFYTVPKCKVPYGILPDPSDCGRFITCVNGEVANAQFCPDENNFDSITSVCKHPREAICEKMEEPLRNVTANSTCEKLTDPTTCNTYIVRCNKGPEYGNRTYDMYYACPGNMIWDEEKLACDAPRKVKCNNRTHYATPLCKKPSGNFEEPADCHKFLSCYLYRVVRHRPCPAGLYYDQASDRCDYHFNVNCHKRPVIDVVLMPRNTTTEAAPSMAMPNISDAVAGVPSCLGPDGLFPHPLHCNQYIACYGGVPMETFFCPVNQNFDFRDGHCKRRDNVTCVQRPWLMREGPVPVVGNGSCTFSQDDTNCGGFVLHCLNSTVNFSCPGELRYDENTGECKMAANVDCNGRPEYKAICNRHNGNFEEPTNCGEFVSCAYNRVFRHRRCPASLNFNLELNSCDWPFRVTCGDRPTKEPKGALVKDKD